ncbi:MAG: copper resistance protein NlpE N-terminal domain-containing protein [Anaerolineae bacterium]
MLKRIVILFLALSMSAFQANGDKLTGGVWQWQQTQDNSGQVTTPADPSRYTLEFLADGAVAVQADCNRGTGKYTVDASALTFGPIAATLMGCPADSQDSEFLRQLSQVKSYLFKDGKLYLELPVDTGSMEFSRAGQAEAATPDDTGQAYTVQAGDWLSKIAQQQLGDPLAYPAIVAATYAKAAEDNSFAVLTDANAIEAGQKLWIPASKFVGVYGASLPAASSPGRQMTLTLNLDNSAQLSSDYLNGEAPIVEIGTWQDNGNNTATVSLSGRLDGVVYEAPVAITFRLEGSTLTATEYDQTLYGSAGLTLQRQVSAPPVAQTDQAVGIYKALLPAASSPGIDSTLYLNIDNTVRLVEDYLNGEAAIAQVGNWSAEGDRISVTISGREGEAAQSTPDLITFILNGNTLATTPDEDLYGSAGRRYLRFETLATGQEVIPYDAAAAAKMMSESGLAGIYKGFSPAASCCGLDWTLYLSPDNKASLKSDYLNGEAPILESGTWQVTDDNLTVTLEGAEKPLTFRVAEGVLISNEFTIFGEAPLRMYRFEVAAQSAGQPN